MRTAIDRSVELTMAMWAKQPDSKLIEHVVDGRPPLEPALRSALREPYVASTELLDAVNMATALGRPLLGDPGCGKTRLAHAVAYALGLPIEEAYIKSTSRAQDLLYTFDAVRQLYDAQTCKLASATEAYVRFGPLGRAIVRATLGRRSVVLLDEIDKADIDFPNDLLWELDRLEFAVAEVDAMRFVVATPQLRPIVIVTHNEEKPLPAAFLRRCVFFHLDFPNDRVLLGDLLQVHGRNDGVLASRAIDVLLRLRSLDLSKKPSLSELLDWVGYLEAVETPVERLSELPHIGILLKQQVDQQLARKEIAAPASRG
jgi:MoxR-like ATPase